MRLTSKTTLRAPRARRPGLTLIELLIVLVLLGVVAGGMLGIVARQQQFYTGNAGIIETRGSVRQGLTVLQGVLRTISPKNGDIYSMGRTFVELREPTGSSIICQFGVTRNLIVLPPTALSAGTGLTSWLAAPQIGDSVLIYDSGRKVGTADDTWDKNDVTVAPIAGTTCPTSTGFTTTAAEAAAGWTITLRNTLALSVLQGAAVRFFRPARYELFQASDGLWYLGMRDCMTGPLAASCSGLTAITGPFLPAAESGPSGLELTYYDVTGAVTSDPSQVRRIDIVLRARSASVVNTPGRPSGIYQDSLATSVTVRN
jgi:prepilin-type N-terminal cleavage/methylation domain-containing protein